MRSAATIADVGHSYELVGTRVAYLSMQRHLTTFDLSDFTLLDLFPDNKYDALGAHFEGCFVTRNGCSTVLNSDFSEHQILPYQIAFSGGGIVIGTTRSQVGRFVLGVEPSWQGKELWRKELKRGKFIHVTRKHLIISEYLDDSRFGCFLSTSGDSLWQFDCSSLGTWHQYHDGTEKQTQVRRLLGCYASRLYVLLNSGKILVLDIDTGAQLDILFNGEWAAWGFSILIELDKAKGVLLQLHREDYAEVDLSTHQIVNVRSEDMVSKSLESKKRVAYDGQHVYFSDDYHDKIGAFNRSTHEVDWVYDFAQVEPRVEVRYARSLKLRGNRLLALDNHNTLHVFEKEEVL